MFEIFYTENNIRNLFISRIDPRAKLLILSSFIGTVLLLGSDQIAANLSLSIIFGFVLFVSRINWRLILKSVFKLYPMILLISVFQLLSVSENAFSYSSVFTGGIDWDNWHVVIGFQYKMLLILGATMIFIISTPYTLLLQSLEWLRLPSWIIAVAFFSYRFIFILSYELHRLYIAYRSRYIRLSLLRRLSTQVRLLSVFFVKIFDRNEQLYQALISRGFTGHFPLQNALRWQSSDTFLIFSFGSFLVFMLLI